MSLGCEPLGPFHQLPDQRRGEVPPVGEVAVERRLPYACTARDLVHRDVCAVCEQLSGGSQDRFAVPLSVLAPGGLADGSHANQCSSGERCPQPPGGAMRNPCIQRIFSHCATLFAKR
jgi:hypothetical protein